MAKKKILVVYYSRTGTTRKVGREIARELKADFEEIIDKKDRSGALGYMRAGKDAMSKRLTEIADIKSNLADYNIVIVGTPIWGWTVTPAVRTFLAQNCNWIRKVAFFCTMGGSGDEKAFDEMARISEKDPVATLTLLTKEVNEDQHKEKLAAFAKYLKSK